MYWEKAERCTGLSWFLSNPPTLSHETLVLWPFCVFLGGGDVLLLLGLAPPAPKPLCPHPSLSVDNRRQNIKKWTEPADHECGLEKNQQFSIKKCHFTWLLCFQALEVTMSSLFLQLHLCLVPLHNRDRGAHTCPMGMGTLKTNKGWAFSYLKK